MTNFRRQFKSSDLIKKPKLIWLAFLTGMVGSWTQPAFAEGSKELNANGGYRPFLEYRNDLTAGIARQATIYVYANNNETINLGSSALGLGNGDIRYTAPNGSSGTCRVNKTGGLIANRTEELAGPSPNTNGYTPCIVNVGTNVSSDGPSGIWKIEFISPNLANTTNPTAIPVTTAWTQNNDASWIAAWDVTVRSGGQTITGRSYAKYLPLNMGGINSPVAINSKPFIQTKDGYLYQLNLNGLDPFGFILFADNRGFIDGSGNPLYQSVTLASALFLTPNNQQDNVDENTHKIFFNQPDTLLPREANTPNGRTWLLQQTNRQSTFTNFRFVGKEGTENQGGTVPPGINNFVTGTFRFQTTAPGPYTLILDLNGNGTYGDGNDRVFVGNVTTTGSTTVTIDWDGKDAAGNPVPASDAPYDVRLFSYRGEVHFPLLDPENNPNGIIVQRLNPPSQFTFDDVFRVFYDDTQVGGNSVLPQGTSSQNGAHAFPGTFFGDNKGIDTWVFAPSDPLEIQGGIRLREADLEISKTHEPTNPLVGGQVTYAIRVTNKGPSSLNTDGQSENIDARVTDTIPSQLSNVSWTCAPASGAPAGSICRTSNGTGNTIDTRVNLPVNGVVELRVTGTLANDPALVGTIVRNDRAVVERSKDVTDPNDYDRQGINNNVAQDEFTVSANAADVSIAKTQTSGNPVTPGQNITYNLVVTASGNADSTNVQVNDNIPAGFNFVSNSGDCTTAFPCNLGTITTGQTRTITTTLAVPANYNGASPVTNTATVNSGNDSNPNNNTSNAQTTVTIPQNADVAIAKTQTSANPVTPGQNITYNLVVTASGSTDSSNVQVNDNIPAGFNFVSNSGDCTTAFPCNLGTIPTGQTRTITTTLAVPANYNGASPVTNTATVNSGNDSNPNNNSANAQTTVAIPQTADVSIAKTQTSANPVTPGQNITYNLVVTASGSTDSSNVQVNDNIPAGFNFVSNSGDCTTAFPCNLGTIPTGQTRTITTTLAVPANYNGASPAINTATVNSGNDSNPNNNSASASTNIQQNASADVVTTKTGPATIAPGGSITYTITTTNNGPAPAINVVVRDNIPPETTFSSASDGGTFANGVVTFPVISSLASGANVTRTVTVTAPNSGGPLVNRASNTSDTPDPTPNNNDGSQPPAQVTTTINQPPAIADVVTTKTGPATIAPGGTITYVIVTTNNGPGLATNVVVRDTIPPETTFSSASDGGTFANGVVTFPAISSLPTGINVIRTVTVTAPASGGPLVNRVSNTSDTPDPTPSNNDGSQPPAQVTTTLTQSQPSVSADVVTTKTGPATIAPGGSITYTITTRNNGPSPATNVIIRDTIPPETTFNSASDGGTFANGVVTFPPIPSLASGASVTRTVTVTAPASGGPLVNRASNTSDTPDPTPNNNDGSQPPAQVVTTITNVADVVTTKTGPTTIAPNGVITYTITTSNNGPVAASNVIIRDTLPPEVTFNNASDGGTFANGVVTFPPIPSLAPNTSVTRTVTVTAPASGGPLVNRAGNTSDTPDPTPNNNDGSQPPAQVVTTITTTNVTADVVTTKTGPSTVAPGGTITYTITTANNGPAPATNVVIRDTLPAGTTFSSASDGGSFANGIVTFPPIPNLASGASVTRTVTITAPASGGPLVNRTSSTSDTPDPTPANNDGSQPPAQVVTTITTASNTADVVTTKTGPSTVAPGGTIAYTITTANNGPAPATNVVIRDTLPAGTTFGSASDGGTFADGVVTFPAIPSLAPNTSVTRTITITAPNSGGPLVNRASNSSDTPDPTPANNDGSQPPAQVVTTLSASTSADVVTTKTGPSTVSPGGTIAYTITTRNNGPDAATNVIIRDAIPPETTFNSVSDGGTFANGVVTFPAIPSLAPNTSVTRTITITAPASGGPLVNRASNSSDTPDPTPANNDGSQPPAQVVTTLTVPTPADVVTTKTGPTEVNLGGTITYTITARNNGPNAATNVIIRDTIPPEVTFNNASDGGILVNGVVVFPAIPSLASGASVTRTITVTAPNTGGPLVNRVASTADNPDPTPDNNNGSQPPSQVTTTLTPQTTNVQVTQTVSPIPVPAGSNVTLTAGVTNNGTVPATNVVLSNPLPPNVTFVSATPSQGSCTFANNTVTCNLGTIAPGQTVNVSIVVTPTQPGNISNPISVSGTNIATSSNNNVVTPIQVIPPQTDVEVKQTAPTEPQPVGNNTTLNTEVTNKGPVPATSVTLTNPLPPNTTFVSATPSQGTCELTNNNIVCNLGDLNPGQTVTVPIVVTPTAPGTLTNQVTIASPSDSTPTNNQASAIAQIVPREPRVRLVKRITSVTRSGSITLFNDLVDDPTDQNDNAPGWSQFRPLGLVTVPASAPVRSGDTVEYTIYYLSDGTTPADDVRICDAIPTNTTFIPDAFGSGRGMQLNLAGVISALTNEQDSDVGRFFSALAPLPTGNPCLNPNNENGTVLFNIDRIPNTTGNNFGFVRFRVRID